MENLLSPPPRKKTQNGVSEANIKEYQRNKTLLRVSMKLTHVNNISAARSASAYTTDQ